MKALLTSSPIDVDLTATRRRLDSLLAQAFVDHATGDIEYVRDPAEGTVDVFYVVRTGLEVAAASTLFAAFSDRCDAIPAVASGDVLLALDFA